MDVTIAKAGAQFLQSVRPESRKHQEPLDCKQSMHFTKYGHGIVKPGQHQVRPHETDRLSWQGQAGGICDQQRWRPAAQEREQPAQPRALRLSGLQHRFAKIDAQQQCLGITFAQCAETGAGAATKIKDSLRFDAHIVEAFEHAPADFALQHRHFIVGGRSPRKISLYLALLDELRLRLHRRAGRLDRP